VHINWSTPVYLRCTLDAPRRRLGCLQKNTPNIEDQEEFIEVAKAALMLPTELPEAHAPRGRKRDLYYEPSVFEELDKDVFEVRWTVSACVERLSGLVD